MRRLLPSLLFILLLAFALRVAGLEAQSLWSDEGLSVYRARQALTANLGNAIVVDGVPTQDTNPPLYFLLLGGWRALVGESVFALRTLNVLLSLLTVALLGRVAARLAGRRAGMAAVLLLAISPFHIWQTQELRNYALLLLLNLISVYALARWLRAPRPHWLVLGLLAGGLGVYTHYFGFFIFALWPLALTTGWWRGRARRSPSRRLWVVAAVLGLAVVPALLVAARRLVGAGQSGFVYVPLPDLISHAASAFAVGFRDTVVQPLAWVLPAWLLAAAGALWLARAPARRAAAGLLLAYLWLPLLILAALSTVTPLYNGPRHLIMSLPPFLVLAAAGAAAGWSARSRAARPATAILALALIVVQGHWLIVQATDPDLVKDDWRGLAAYLEASAGPEDVVVVHDAISAITFDYYYGGQAPVANVPAYAREAPEAAVARLAALGAVAERVWFISETRPRDGFPELLLPGWAGDNWLHLATCRFPSVWLDVRLDAYLPQWLTPVEAGPPAPGLDLGFAGDVRLIAVQGDDSAPAGGFWWGDLFWALPAGAPDHTAVIRLLDGGGQTVAQIDLPLAPAGGDLTRQRLGMPLPATLPPGPYAVWLRLVDAAGGPVADAGGAIDHRLIEQLEVTPAAADTCRPTFTPAYARFAGGLDLLGYRPPPGLARPGHLVPLTLVWRARGTPAADYGLRLEFVDAAGVALGDVEVPLGTPERPATAWRPGALIASEVRFVLPADAPTGDLSVSLALVRPASDTRLPAWEGAALWPRVAVSVGELAVESWPLETTVPPTAYAFQAAFGEPAQIELRGVELAAATARPGEDLAITLYWRSLVSQTDSYKVFLHLADPAGGVPAQADGVPAGGLRPTTSWRAGEVIVDSHTITLPPDLAPGRYRLWVGLYAPDTFDRLPAFAGGAPQPDRRAPLIDVEITP